MMDVKRLTDDLSVAGQVVPADVPAMSRAGFRAVICNRPDGEGTDQPDFRAIEVAARAAGIEVRYLPVVSGGISNADVAAFGALLEELPTPVLAYCRTGTRSTMLWSLHEGARGRPVREILAVARAAGYDMTDVIRHLAPAGGPSKQESATSTT